MRARSIHKSKYKGVHLMRDRKLNEFWACVGEINGLKFFSKHDSERDAAKSFDVVMMKNGKMPVNIYRQETI